MSKATRVVFSVSGPAFEEVGLLSLRLLFLPVWLLSWFLLFS